MRLTYKIAAFSKEWPHYELARHQIYDIDFEELSMIFDPEGLDPDLIHCYDVDDIKAVLIQEYVKEQLDLDKFFYQLSCEEVGK